MNSATNTDRELWRETPNFESPSIHVTRSGRIGINIGGNVIEQTLRQWHANAWAANYATPRAVMLAIEVAVYIEGSQKAAAKRFGISPQYLSDILKGKREIPDKVARAFGVRRSTLFVPIEGAVHLVVPHAIAELPDSGPDGGKP